MRCNLLDNFINNYRSKFLDVSKIKDNSNNPFQQITVYVNILNIIENNNNNNRETTGADSDYLYFYNL